MLKDSSGNVYTAVQKGSEYYYEIAGFAPGEIFAKKRMMFADDEANAFDVCIGNYANWAVDGTDENLKNTIVALYNYDEYAKGFIDENYTPGQGGILN